MNVSGPDQSPLINDRELLFAMPHEALVEHTLGLTAMLSETEIAEQQAELRHRANYDPLTGLLNRRAWGEKLEALIGEPEAQFGILFIDLNNFKRVNDDIDHDAGDRLLIKVGQAFRTTLRSRADTDRFPDRFPDVIARERRFFEAAQEGAIGRLGGDEFAIICDLSPSRDPELTPAARLDTIKTRLRYSFDQILAEAEPDVHRLGFDMAIGSCIWQAGMSAKELLAAADHTMQKDKKQLKAAWRETQPLPRRLLRRVGEWALRTSGHYDERIHT